MFKILEPKCSLLFQPSYLTVLVLFVNMNEFFFKLPEPAAPPPQNPATVPGGPMIQPQKVSLTATAPPGAPPVGGPPTGVNRPPGIGFDAIGGKR